MAGNRAPQEDLALLRETALISRRLWSYSRYSHLRWGRLQEKTGRTGASVVQFALGEDEGLQLITLAQQPRHTTIAGTMHDLDCIVQKEDKNEWGEISHHDSYIFERGRHITADDVASIMTSLTIESQVH